MFVADEAFPLHTHLMKPNPFIRHLDHEQHVYSYRLSRARHVFRECVRHWKRCKQMASHFYHDIPEAVSWVTLAALTLHNLRVQATDTYIPPALVDNEDEDHHIVLQSWCSDITLQSVPAGRDWNATRTAMKQRDNPATALGDVDILQGLCLARNTSCNVPGNVEILLYFETKSSLFRKLKQVSVK